MKKTYLLLSVGLFILGLIIAFENILMYAPVIFLFKQFNGSLFLPLLIVLCLGALAGFFLGMVKFTGGKEDSSDEVDF
jgi:uncharacterized integral membrane protein